MNQKYVYHGFGIVAFLITLITLLLTVQPSVPFWDCGEFSAASIWQQVPHPPGAPLFLMIGKVFHILIPFGDAGWRVNLVSVLSGAFTIWFLYLITVKAIVYMRKDKGGNFAESFAIYASAFVGAIAYGFSDTFWFNAVESEVYSLSTVFVAVIVYLMMKWNEDADKPGNERYILLIAYLIGLSTGVHLLSILTVFSIAMLIYFRKYKLSFQSFIVMGIIAILVFFMIYPGIIKWVPAFLGGDLPFKNECKEAVVSDSPAVIVFFILLVLGAIATLWYSYKNNKPILNLAMFSFLLMLFGYSTYTQILLRSNANSPMNENEPKNMNSLVSYLGREQYGDAPNWPRRYQQDEEFIRFYNEKNDKGEFVYGQWNQPTREEVQCKDGSGIMIPKYNDVNTEGELSYMFKYQIYHMYFRYFLWNFVGRLSDVQDADYAFTDTKNSEILNYKSGYANLFPVRFYALPLLIGLIGLFFHFWKDPKTALIFFIMFLLMGVLTAIAQNQQNPQPRERDYFYAGSFMVWCMWIGFGVYGLIEWIGKRKFTTPLVTIVVILSLLAVPFNMAMGGWKIHSRAGDYLPFDYSYNILQSTEKNAIIFTNGDNDTFPVWFLQDVEGVRRDVRVVNLSLGNTLWYVHQLKQRNPWGAEKIPLSFSDESLTVSESDPAALTYELGEAQNVEIPVAQDIMAKYTSDPALLADPKMKFTFAGKYYGERDKKRVYIFRVQDKLVFDILKQVKFTRPVYFSTTVGPDAFCGLERFFRYEGMAARICPVEQKEINQKPIDSEITEKCLLRIDNSNNFHKEQYYGFKLRNLDNPSVFYDEVHRRLIPNYRELYMNFASTVLKQDKNSQKAIAILDTMNKYLSAKQFPMTYEYEFKLANLYHDAGAKEQFNKYAMMSIRSCEELIRNNKLNSEAMYGEIMGNYWGPYRLSSMLYSMMGDYTSAKMRLQELFRKTSDIYGQIQNNPGYKDEIQKVAMNMYNVTLTIDEYTIDEVNQKQGKSAALDTAMSIINRYQNSPDPNLKYMSQYLQQKVLELGGKVDSALSFE